MSTLDYFIWDIFDSNLLSLIKFYCIWVELSFSVMV